MFVAPCVNLSTYVHTYTEYNFLGKHCQIWSTGSSTAQLHEVPHNLVNIFVGSRNNCDSVLLQMLSLRTGKFKVIGGRGVQSGLQLREPQVRGRGREGGGERGRECVFLLIDSKPSSENRRRTSHNLLKYLYKYFSKLKVCNKYFRD